MRRHDFQIVKAPKTPGERELQRQAVQALASKVHDESHWQQILGSAAEDQRAELERVVGPMLAFRRAAPCTTPDCASGLHGIWQPVLEVRSPLAPNDPSWVPIELRLCDTCKEEAQLANFLTESIWSQILIAWDAPDTPPIRRLTTLTWERSH